MKTRVLVLALAAALTLVPGSVATAPAGADTLYWDSNGTTAGTGATTAGTWGTNTYWTTDSAGTIAPGAYVADSDVVFSAGTNAGAHTVTVSGTQTANSITYQEGTVTMAGTATPALTIAGGGIIMDSTLAGTLTFNNTLKIVLAASQSWTNNSTRTLSIASPIKGNATTDNTFTLTFDGASTGPTTISSIISDGTAGGKVALTQNSATSLMTLSAANTYAGPTTVSAGVLKVTGATSLPGGNGATGGISALVLDGGVLGLGQSNFSRDLGNGVAQVQWTANGGGFAAFTADRTVNLGGASAGVTWGAGSFVPTGSTLILGAPIADRRVDFQNPIELGTAVRTLQVDNGSAVVDATLSGALTSGAGGGLTKTGTGTLNLTGTNTYSGVTTVSDGTLQFAKQVSLYNNTPASWTATNLVVDSGGTAAFNVGGTGEFTSGDIDTVIALGTATGGFKSGSAIALDTTNAGGNFSYGSAIANPNAGANVLSLIKLGTGSLTLSGTSSYSGGTTLAAGTLLIGNNSALGAGPLTINAGTTIGADTAARTLDNDVSMDGNFTMTGALDLTLAGDVAIAVTRTITVAGDGELALTGDISGAGGLTKNGAGTLVLSANNSFSGTKTLSAGTLVLGSTSPLGPNGGKSGFVASTGTTILANQDLVIPNDIQAGGNFTIGGSHDLTFHDLYMPNTGTKNVTIDNTGKTNWTRVSLVASGTGVLTVTVNGGDTTISGLLDRIPGLTKSGPGKLILSGANTYTGVKYLADAGTLQFAKQVSLYNNTTTYWTDTNVTVNSGATAAFSVGGTGEYTSGNLDILLALGTATGGFKSGSTVGFDTTNAAGGNFAYDSEITNPNGGSNVLNVTKLGTGTLVLSAANTYTGTTTVNGGTLSVTGSIGSTAAVTVNSGSKLIVTGTVAGAVTANNNGSTVAGTGSIGGLVTMNTGTILSPGTSAGELTVDSLKMENGSFYEFEGEDLTSVTGTLTLTDNWTLKLLNNNLLAGGSVAIFSYGTLGADPDLDPTFDASALIAAGIIPDTSGLSLTNNIDNMLIVLNGLHAPPVPMALSRPKDSLLDFGTIFPYGEIPSGEFRTWYACVGFTNNGTLPGSIIDLQGAVFEGDAASAFSIVWGDPAGQLVGPGSSTAFDIKFSAAGLGAGTYTATVTFKNDSAEGDVTYNLTALVTGGGGVIPEPAGLGLAGVILVALRRKRHG